MKKLAILLTSVLLFASCCKNEAKYVFYFIADGAGLNAYELADQYYRNVEGDSLAVLSFPIRSFATNYPADQLTTDSSAAGTALASGFPTNNYASGLDAEGKPVDSIIKYAHDAGYHTGVITKVGITHATPAAFFAHAERRSEYEKIAGQFAECDFIDFAAGGAILSEEHGAKRKASFLAHLQAARDNGWFVTGDVDAAAKAIEGKTYLHYGDGTKKELPYIIDAPEGDVTLVDLTRAAIQNLSARGGKYILVCEGGKADYAAHGNDAGTYVRELYEFDQCVRLALEVYKKYPKETLIVVCSDHETGGIVYGANGGKPTDIECLKYQKVSLGKYSDDLRKMKEQNPTFDEVMADIAKNFSLGDKVAISDEELQVLKDIYKRDFQTNKGVQTLYEYNDYIADVVVKILAKKANCSWASYSHSASYIPVLAIGQGADIVGGAKTNCEIPRQMSKIMGFDEAFMK